MKEAVTKAPVVLSSDFYLPFKVQTDANDIGLGAVLTQEFDGGERVIAYGSRLLNSAKNYSVSEHRVPSNHLIGGILMSLKGGSLRSLWTTQPWPGCSTIQCPIENGKINDQTTEV